MENFTELQQELAWYKNREMELERSEARLRMAIDSTHLGTWDFNPKSGGLEWSEECRKIYGLPLGETVNYGLFADHIYPDDREFVEKEIQNTMDPSGNGEYNVTYRILRFNSDEVRWINAQGKVYFDGQREPERFIGTVIDLTENKLAEEKGAKLAAIVESSDDAIVSKTLQGIITSWNYAAELLFGYTEKEVKGKSITILIPEDRLDEERVILTNIRSGIKINHYETLRLHKSGREIPVSLTISPIKDRNGRIIGASKIIRNITEKRAAETNLRRYAENLERLNEVARQISERLDASEILQKVTDATTQLTGAAFGAFFYDKINENGELNRLYALSGASAEAFEKFGMPCDTAVCSAAFAGEGIVRVDDITSDPRYAKNSRHNGMPKGHLPIVSYLAVPVISKSGQVIGGLLYGHPEAAKFTREHEQLVVGVSTQAAVALDNAKLYEEIQKLNDKKDEFIGLASHELKTPVTSLSGYLQILNRALPNEDKNKPHVKKALTQINKLSALISDLLDVSKIETGQLPLSFSTFDLLHLVREAIELMQYTTRSHRIIFHGNNTNILVNADRQRIEQVLINLLSNAIKYSPKADKVTVTVSVIKNRALVSVRDFGMGISKEQQDRVFSRFYRVEELEKHISGLGIGLYISKEIVNRHNGKLWLESEPGKGSVFTFEIPVEQSV